MNGSPSKSALRAYQDRAANAGWRIPLIPYDDPSKAMRIQTNWPALAGALVFGVIFLGLWTGKLQRTHVPLMTWIAVLVGAWCFSLVSIFVVARLRKRGWVRLQAVCLDRECQRTRNGWAFRLRCRFEYEGQAYTVTPSGPRFCFPGQAGEQYLTNAIGADGKCWLRVNPRNPLQTELARAS